MVLDAPAFRRSDWPLPASPHAATRPERAARQLAGLAADSEPGTRLGTKDELRALCGVSVSAASEALQLVPSARPGRNPRQAEVGELFASRQSPSVQLGGWMPPSTATPPHVGRRRGCAHPRRAEAAAVADAAAIVRQTTPRAAAVPGPNAGGGERPWTRSRSSTPTERCTPRIAAVGRSAMLHPFCPRPAFGVVGSRALSVRPSGRASRCRSTGPCGTSCAGPW